MNSKLIVMLAVVGFLNSTHVCADTPAVPTPYVVEAGDYFLVMLPNNSFYSKEYSLRYFENLNKRICGKKEYRQESNKQTCAGLEAAKRYTQSGLYHKNRPAKPLWTIDWYAFSVFLSSDAQHLVRMGPWAGDAGGLAVSFYQLGKLVADYSIKDLVDDENRLLRSSSHIFWKNKTVFDDKTSTLFLKTVDNNEFTFDIRSGRIITYKYDAPVYNAQVMLSNGERKKLHNIRACSALTMVSLLQGSGVPDHVINLIKPQDSTSIKGGEILRPISMPFEFVKKVRFVEPVKDDRLLWEISMRDGNSRQFIADESFAGFCGIGGGGKEVKLSPKEIRELYLSPARTNKPPAGHRSVAQRMRWDKKNWEIARNRACDNIDTATFTTLQDIQHLIAKFHLNECSSDSSNYVNALDRVGDWIQKQPNADQIKGFAIEVANMQRHAKLYYQAYSLYEYVLNSYDQTVGYENLETRNAKTQLVMDMVITSSKAGATVTAKKWVGVLDAINGKINPPNKM